MSVTTTSTVALLCATTLAGAGLAAGRDPVADLSTLVFLVGLILIGFRLLQVGNVIDNISVPVLTGVKTGVGLTVAADQLPKLLGVPDDSDATGSFEVAGAALRKLGDANGPTVALSAVTIAAVLVPAAGGTPGAGPAGGRGGRDPGGGGVRHRRPGRRGHR
jgi:MFS superfamily sulfate permease-like transporter